MGYLADRQRNRERRSASGANLLTAGFAPPAPILSGTYITPQTALSLAAVYASINVISRDIASMPRFRFKKLANGGRVIDEDKPTHELLNIAPDDSGEMDAFSFWQTSVGHVLGHGKSYSEIVRDPSNGEARELHLLDPQKTTPKRTESGKLYYELPNKKTLPPENVLHLHGLGFNGIQGYSPITVCRQTIGLAVGVEQFGAAFFGNGAVARGGLKVPKRLSEAAQNNLRRSVNQIHQGSQSAHQLLILEEGMEWFSTQVNPDDGQWIATRQFQVVDIARIFSIPPHKIGDYSQAHLSNVEESNLDYIAMTLFGWVCAFESQLNLKLLTRDDRKKWIIGFDMESLLRANTAGRMARYQTLRNLGAINADEIRLREGMNPIGAQFGGDLYVVQGQYIPLNQIGKEPKPIAPATPRSLPFEMVHTGSITPSLNGRAHLDDSTDDPLN